MVIRGGRSLRCTTKEKQGAGIKHAPRGKRRIETVNNCLYSKQRIVDISTEVCSNTYQNQRMDVSSSRHYIRVCVCVVIP